MAIVTTDDKYYKDIADSLRYGWYRAFDDSYLGKFKPSEMAGFARQMYSDCYDSGFNKGKAQGVTEGKQAEYDAFWSVFQKNGNSNGANYYYAFAYSDRFTDENYNPKYDIICASGNSPAIGLFYANESITDTKVPIRVLGTSMQSTFYSCKNLRRIPLLEVHASVVFNTTFGACVALEEITIAGTIGKAIDFSPCQKLTRASIESIIGALSESTSNIEARFSADAVNKAFETSEGAQDGSTSDEWDTLGGENRLRQNWAVSLI